MQPIENRITNKLTRGVPGNRGVLPFFPKGALTHHPPEAGGGIPPVGRAVRSPRGNCAFCGKHQTMPPCPWMLAVIVCAAQGGDAPPMPPWKTCHWQLFSTMGIATGDTLSFCEKETKTRREGGENEWQFIIWKRRSSAAALVDPLLPLLLI